jgi:DNA-binding response OmpR family regulator
MSTQKIMIIEDDLDQAKGLGMRLKMNGYDVVMARDAISAIAVIRKENPNLILLDIGLPAGDGFIVMERIKNLMISFAPIIILTGRDPQQNEKKAIDAGAVAFFQKPADNDELMATIEATLSKSSDGLMHKTA